MDFVKCVVWNIFDKTPEQTDKLTPDSLTFVQFEFLMLMIQQWCIVCKTWTLKLIMIKLYFKNSWKWSHSHLHLHLISVISLDLWFTDDRNRNAVWGQRALLRGWFGAAGADFRAAKLFEVLPYRPFHLRNFNNHPQRNQTHTEQSKEPAQSIGPGWVDVGFVELQRLVSHHWKDEGTHTNTRSNKKPAKFHERPGAITYHVFNVVIETICTIYPSNCYWLTHRKKK